MDSIIVVIALSSLRLALPLFFASIGGYFSEKVGVAQIALESYLLVGAFTAATVSHFSHSTILAFFAAAIVTAIFSQLFSLLILKWQSNSIVVGTGLNLLAMGIIPIVSKSIFNSTGSTPSLENSPSAWFPYLVLIIAGMVSYYLAERSNWGLFIKFAGEKKSALENVGISPKKIQWQSLTFGAAVTGLGGAVLSTCLASNYSPQMSAGRGFIALAALIFAGWNLPRAWLACLAFGFCEALQIQFQSMPTISHFIAPEFIQMLPYLATLLAILFIKTKNPPAELR